MNNNGNCPCLKESNILFSAKSLELNPINQSSLKLEQNLKFAQFFTL